MKIVMAEYVTYNSAYKVGGHHLAQYLSGAGNEILYISSPLNLSHLRYRFSSDGSSWHDLYNGFNEWRRGGVRRSSNLISYTPLTLLPPWRYGLFSSRWVLQSTLKFTVPSLKKLIRKMGFQKSDVLMIAHPYLSGLVEMVESKLTICRVNDDIEKFETMPKSVGTVEKWVAQQSDLVIVTSQPLYDKFDYIYPNRLHYLPNGVDFQFYQSYTSGEIPSELQYLSKPLIVYMGAMNYWFDVDLISFCAQRLWEYNFVLIGARQSDMSELDALENVHFLGRKPYEELPRYLHACDVGIIPFKLTPMIESVNPLKLYEYMACGLPVVATRWREIESVNSPAKLASSSEEFLCLLCEILAALPDLERQRFRRFAYSNSWQERGKRLEELFVSEIQTWGED